MYSLRRHKTQVARTRKALLELEKRGLVQSYSDDGEERWRLTDRGEEALSEVLQLALQDES